MYPAEGTLDTQHSLLLQMAQMRKLCPRLQQRTLGIRGGAKKAGTMPGDQSHLALLDQETQELERTLDMGIILPSEYADVTEAIRASIEKLI
jgi:hypothetical protein